MRINYHEGAHNPGDDGVTIDRNAPCPRCAASLPDLGDGDTRERLTVVRPLGYASCAACGWRGYERLVS